MMKADTLSVLGATIRRLREEQGLSLDELARKCGYTAANSRSTIQKIEAGKRDVPDSKLKLIAEALGVTPGQLIGMSVLSDVSLLNPEERNIIEMFRKLNSSGKFEAVTRLAEMTELEKYTKK